MKLVTFQRKSHPEQNYRLGALLGEDAVLGLQAAAVFFLREEGKTKDPLGKAVQLIPDDICAFLERGGESLDLAGKAIAFSDSCRKRTGKPSQSDAGEDLLLPLASVSLKAPIPRPGKLIAMGLNFYDHAAENKVPPPEMPVGFLKAATSLTGPGAPVPYPRSTKQLDYEIEMAIVIGKRGKDIPKERAFEFVAGYTILNDLSARDIQSAEMKKRLVLLSKSLDGLGPLGPTLVTKDEVPDPDNLTMELFVNEEPEPRQKSNTRQMVFKVADLVAYWSQMTLEPGDIISSGTPGGVAIFRQPPEKWLLKPGDVVEARIEKLGVLRNRIVAE
jgi:acylpyruvate hydrolase